MCYRSVMDENAQPATPLSRSVLLVDDDERVRRIMTMLLRFSGEWACVDAVADRASALERAALLQPDLVLLDLWLADGDSLDLLPHLRMLEPAPLVVILSGDQSTTLRDRAFALGASAYLDKLQPMNELLDALRRLWR